MSPVRSALSAFVRTAVRAGVGTPGAPAASRAGVTVAAGRVRVGGGVQRAQRDRGTRTLRCAAGSGGIALGLALATLSQQHGEHGEHGEHRDDMEAMEDVLSLVDRLSDWNRPEEASKSLSALRGSRHPEVLWRLGRVQYLHAERIKAGTAGAAGAGAAGATPVSGKEAKAAMAQYGRLVREGFASIQMAIEMDPACGRAHIWLSVLRYALAELEGTLARLKSVDVIREDMERAVDLLPADGLSRTMLGMWFFETSQLSWLERQVVKAAGQTVPGPSRGLQQALHWFLESERLQPGISNLNDLMLGKTLLVLEGVEAARPHLERAVSAPPRTQTNAKAQLDARALLQTWNS